MNYNIAHNSISFSNGKTVAFDFDIKETVELGGVLVVLLDVPAKVVMTENVFGVSLDGEKLWQIEPIPETSTNKWDKWNCYINVVKTEDRYARLRNWKGWEVDLDVTTGRVLKRMWLKQ